MFRCGSPDHSRVWRGFPIRTPWDHSPVIDSPRLIADSYVLLRLLMPRHPPCALKNLTTKIKNIFERTTKPTTHPKACSQIQVHISWKLLLIKDARVHYVVLKQQPRTTHPTHQTPKGTTACDQRSQETRNKAPPTRKQTLPGSPVASGPNSVPNTKPPTPLPHRSRTAFRRNPSVLGAEKNQAAAIR